MEITPEPDPRASLGDTIKATGPRGPTGVDTGTVNLKGSEETAGRKGTEDP